MTKSKTEWRSQQWLQQSAAVGFWNPEDKVRNAILKYNFSRGGKTSSFFFFLFFCLQTLVCLATGDVFCVCVMSQWEETQCEEMCSLSGSHIHTHTYTPAHLQRCYSVYGYRGCFFTFVTEACKVIGLFDLKQCGVTEEPVLSARMQLCCS